MDRPPAPTRRAVLRAAAALPLLARESGVHAAAASVSIDNFAFSPALLTVAPGTTVTWTNRDDIPHTVVAEDLSFRSKPLDTDDSFASTFPTAGRYRYFCSLHPHMVGVIEVRDGAPSPPAGAPAEEVR
ncbi:cupredoxin domain-containing protein [Methylobacterium sp. JK268]